MPMPISSHLLTKILNASLTSHACCIASWCHPPWCDQSNATYCHSQRPRGLKRRSAAACLLRLWVRIPPGAWIFVCGECCVLSGRGLCDKMITRPEQSYQLWCVVVCDLETSLMRKHWPTVCCCATNKQTNTTYKLCSNSLTNPTKCTYWQFAYTTHIYYPLHVLAIAGPLLGRKQM